MDKLYKATDIGKMIGVSSQTIKDWEANHFIVQSHRIGLRKTRFWGKTKVKLILDFARDNGYIIHDFALPSELREEDDGTS